jgi:hypothetical protein
LDEDPADRVPTFGGTIVFEADPSFRPVHRRDGYLALEDMGLIGDGTTSALVGLDGSVLWLCLPRFDSEPLFCGLLDHEICGTARSTSSVRCARGRTVMWPPALAAPDIEPDEWVIETSLPTSRKTA